MDVCVAVLNKFHAAESFLPQLVQKFAEFYETGMFLSFSQEPITLI